MMRIGVRGGRQMTIGEIVAALEALPLTFETPDGPHPFKVVFDFGDAHIGHLTSWRGIYSELAVTFNDPDTKGYYGTRETTPAEFLAMLRDALAPGRTFPGWKGGEYRMTANTPVWVSQWGQASHTMVVGVRAVYGDIVIDTEWGDV